MNKNVLFIFLISNIIILVLSDNSFTFDSMLEKVKKLGKMKKVAVAGGDNLTILQACRKAKDLNIADCILVGVPDKIYLEARKGNIDISDFELVDKRMDSEIALECATLVREGRADIYAKGSLNIH